MIQTNTQVTEV